MGGEAKSSATDHLSSLPAKARDELILFLPVVLLDSTSTCPVGVARFGNRKDQNLVQ